MNLTKSDETNTILNLARAPDTQGRDFENYSKGPLKDHPSHNINVSWCQHHDEPS